MLVVTSKIWKNMFLHSLYDSSFEIISINQFKIKRNSFLGVFFLIICVIGNIFYAVQSNNYCISKNLSIFSSILKLRFVELRKDVCSAE